MTPQQQLARLFQAIFRQQGQQVARQITVDGAAAGRVPSLDNWVGVAVEAVQPILLRLYQAGMLQTAQRLSERTGRALPLVEGNRNRPLTATEQAIAAAMDGGRQYRPGNAAIFGEPVRRSVTNVTGKGVLQDNERARHTASNFFYCGQLRGAAGHGSKEVMPYEACYENGRTNGQGNRSDIQVTRAGHGRAIGLHRSVSRVRTRLTTRGRLYYTKAVGDSKDVPIAFDFDLFNPKVLEAVEQASLRLCRETLDTATGDLKESIADLRKLLKAGLTHGQALSYIGRKISEVFHDPFRAHRIATTEIARATYGGQVLAAKQSGIVKTKIWMADPAACELCQDLDGEERELDEPFVRGGGPYGTVWHPPLHPFCQCDLQEGL